MKATSREHLFRIFLTIQHCRVIEPRNETLRVRFPAAPSTARFRHEDTSQEETQEGPRIMNDAEYLTEEEILDRGAIKNVPLVLGDGDAHWPCNHWFNYVGTRMYKRSRVEEAESILQSHANGAFRSHQAEAINRSMLPYTPAVFIFDYRIILEGLNRQMASKFHLTDSHTPCGAGCPAAVSAKQN